MAMNDSVHCSIPEEEVDIPDDCSGNEVQEGPPRWYTVVYRCWGMVFWVGILGGSVHGLTLLGVAKVVEMRNAITAPEWVGMAGILAFFVVVEGYLAFQLRFSPMLAKRCFELSMCPPEFMWSLPLVRHAIQCFSCCSRGQQKQPGALDSRLLHEGDENSDISTAAAPSDAANNATSSYLLARNRTSRATIFIARFIDLVLSPLLAAGLLHGTWRRVIVSWAVVVGVSGLVVVIPWLPQPWHAFIDAGVVAGVGWGTLSLLAWIVAIGCFQRWPEHVSGQYPLVLASRLQRSQLRSIDEKTDTLEPEEQSRMDVSFSLRRPGGSQPAAKSQDADAA